MRCERNSSHREIVLRIRRVTASSARWRAATKGWKNPQSRADMLMKEIRYSVAGGSDR